MHAFAEATALRELVGLAPAEDPIEARAADGPCDLRSRRLIPEGREVEQDAEGRVAASDHEDAPARIPFTVATENVRDAVEDPFPGRRLAEGRQAARTQGIRRPVGARGIDHRAGEDVPFGAVLVDSQDEGLTLA